MVKRSLPFSMVFVAWLPGCGVSEDGVVAIAVQSVTAPAVPQDNENTVAFSWPVMSRGVTSPFQPPRRPGHRGVDLDAEQGDPIHAAASGSVLEARLRGDGCAVITIAHGSAGLTTVYKHALRMDVREGAHVERGEVIGVVGGVPGTWGAGRSTTGSHLHFEIHIGGFPVDPLAFLPALGE